MSGDSGRESEVSDLFSGSRKTTFMNSGDRSQGLSDDHGDPLEAMPNIFDVAILIGVGFMVVAMSGFGLKEMMTKEDVTIVKNPGTEQMEIITKVDGEIRALKRTPEQAQGQGKAVGTVYQLEDGRMVWIPGGGKPPTQP